MKSDYPKIFEPITIKRTTIKNRIAMTPMGTNYGETSGEMSNRHMSTIFTTCGNTILKNVWLLLYPRSCAASYCPTGIDSIPER